MVYLFLVLLFCLTFYFLGLIFLRYHKTRLRPINFKNMSLFIPYGIMLGLFNHFYFKELEKVEDPANWIIGILYAVLFFGCGVFVYFYTKRKVKQIEKTSETEIKIRD